MKKRGVIMSERLTTYHCGKAVIKDKNKLSEAMEKLAEFEEKEKCGEWLDAIELAKIAIALQSQKHIPVKPIILDTLNGDIDYECPLCGKQVMSDAESRSNYCGECGCKFDWSEIDASTKSKSQ